MSLGAGDKLGRYEIVESIGRGGMGVVYRARDPRLGRDIAIKVLPEQLAGDPERIRRFQQEARAASAINHPAILTVHDVGTHLEAPYLVTELLEGETLRRRLSRGRLDVPAALDVAARIADGLVAAHAREIVHRDLKPGNVFLTADGSVKILDFGLAKLVPLPDAEGDPDTTAAVTESVALLGTPGYMSPEQARGGAVDFRADQFALGCTLYEMLTGVRPFDKESLPLTLAAVATEEPPPVREHVPGIPAPVAWVVERCLAKEPDRRYRATGDLAIDLATLRDRVDELGGAAGEPTHRGDGARLGAGTPSSGRALATAGGPAAPRRPVPWAWVAAAAALTALVLTGAWIWLSPPTISPVPELRALTYSGRDGAPAAAPDGRTIAFSSERDGRRRIWIKDLESGAEVPLTEGPSDDLPRYSPTGSEILFVRQTGSRSDLYRVPAVGGTPRRIVVDARGGDWMPDGEGIVFLRAETAEGITRTLLGMAGADGSGAEVVVPFEGPMLHHPRVSPDGRRVALSDIGRQAGLPVAVWLVDLERRTASPLPGPAGIGPLSAPAWLGSGDAVAYSRADSVAAQVVGSPSRVLVHPVNSAQPRVVLSTSGSTGTLAAVAAGTLVLDGRTARQNLLEQRLDGEGGVPRWLTRGSSGDRQPVYSADGQWVAFSSRRGGSLDLWAISTETGSVRRLTDDPAEDWDPGFTRDGRLMWSSNRSGSFQIWIADDDGTGPRQVTHGTGDAQNPTATPDGEWIVFVSASPDRPGIFKIRTDGTEMTHLVVGTVVLAETSPDGRHISYVDNWGTEDATLRVVRFADGTHEPFAVALPYDPNPRGVVVGRSRWLPDGSAVAFVNQAEDGTYGVFLQDFEPGRPATGSPRKLAGFDPVTITESFAVSPDGERITLAQWEPVSSLLWAENVPGIEPVGRR